MAVKPTVAESTVRAPRMLSTVLTAEAIAQVRADGDTAEKPKNSAGRWRLNSGAEMVTTVYGLNADRYGYSSPIRCVLDLGKAKFESKTIPCLYAHSSWSLIGNWSNPEVTAAGLFADGVIYQARTDAEANVMGDCVKIRALLEQDHPWQASVGAMPRDGLDGFELIAAGKTVTVNGKTFCGDGEIPLYVMRKPVVFEASVVLWGADSDTGRVAAALMNPTLNASTAPTPAAPAAPAKDRTMTKFAAVSAAFIAALLAAHPGQEAVILAELSQVKEDTDEAAVRASVKDAVGKAELKAARDEIAALKAAKTPAPTPVETPKSGTVVAPVVEAKKAPAFAGGAEESGEAPKTITDGMKLLAAEGSKLTGWALRAEVTKRWPNAERR